MHLLGDSLTRIRKRLSLGKFGLSVATLAGGTALGQAIVVIASPVLTRIYGTEDFGALGVYTSLLTMCLTFASLRYEMAIPLPEDDSTGANLLALSLAIVLIMSLLTGGIVLVLGSQIAVWTNMPSLRAYLWTLPIGILGAGTYQVLNYWALRKRQFRDIARTKVSQSIGMVVIQLVIGLFKTNGPLGLLLGDAFGRAGGSTTLATLVWRRDKAHLKQVHLDAIKRAARRYRRFPLFSSGSGFLNSAGVQLPTILFAALYGPQVAGSFTLGARVLAAPITLIGQSVAQVYYTDASRLLQGTPAQLHALFWITAKKLLLVGALPIFVLGFTASQLFSLIFGAPWRQAGLYVQILSLQYLAQFVMVPLSKTLTVLERQDLQLAWDAGRLVLVAGGLVLAKVLNWADWAAVAAYSVAMLVAYCALFFLSNKALQQRIRTADSVVDPGG